jgi:esterase/lipase superfamily enzyme
MTKTRKRWLIGSGIAIALLAGSFYYLYFMSTSAAVRSAEAFLFRRMTVSQLSENNEFRHFFVTNRQRSGDSAPLDRFFGSDRQAALTFGSFDVSIEPTIGLGMFLNPTDWFQNEEIRLDDVSALERERFVEQLRGLVEASPGQSLLVVIHGFREAFPSALRKTAFIASVLDLNTPVLVFDWPGDQGSSLRGYRAARDVATASGAELADLLDILVTDVRPQRLSILANSMGGQVVVDAFSVLHERDYFADEDNEFDHIILTAPDVDHQQFNERFKNEIRSMADDLTVYVSSNDRALLMSRLINRGLRVGESTLSPDQLDEAASISRLIEPDSSLITLVDVTPVNRTRNFHNFSLETPEFFDDLFLRLTLDETTPPNRLIYRVQTADGNVYWVLTRGR